MATDMINVYLYSCGHMAGKADSWTMFHWCSYPCPACKAKGIESKTSITVRPGSTTINEINGIWQDVS